MYKNTKQEYLYTKPCTNARFVLCVQNIRAKKDPSRKNLGLLKEKLLLLHLREHTLLLHLLYLLAFLLLMLHHSGLRSILLFATVFFNHLSHRVFSFGLGKVKNNIAYMGVVGNSPISAGRDRSGNAQNQGRGGRIWIFCGVFFGFSWVCCAMLCYLLIWFA